MITNVGMAEAAQALIGAFTVIGIGDATTAESASHTDLQAATNKKRKTATASRVTTAQLNDTAQWEATFSAADGLTGTWTVGEAGVFNNVTNGVMLLRKVLSPTKTVDWAAGDTITVTLKDQQKQGA